MEVSELLRSVKETDDKLFSAVDNYRNELRGIDGRLIEIEKAAGRRYHGGGEPAGEETKAMAAWLRGGMETKAIAPLAVSTDGLGITARSDWANRVAELVRESTPMRQIADVIPTSRESWEGLTDRGEPGADWVSETGDRDETAASFLGRHKIIPHELYAYPRTTLQLLEDSEFAVESWLANKVATKFARKESAAFINGDGSGQPTGLLHYTRVPVDVWEWGADPALYLVPTLFTESQYDSAGELEIEDVFDLVDSLEADYLPNARFLMNRKTRNVLRKLKDSDNRYFYQQSMGERLPDTLLGYPVTLAEDLPGPEDGEPCLWFGDFRQAYAIIDRIGMTLQRDTLTKPGFVRWYVRKRVGGALVNPQAVRCLQLGEYTSA